MMKERKLLRVSIVLILTFLLLIACGNAWQKHYDLGMKYLSDGNSEEAIIEFEAAIEIDDMKPDTYIGLAEVYIQQGDFKKAIEILEAGYEKTQNTSLLDKLKETNRNNLNDEEWSLLRTVYDSMKTEAYDEICALNEQQKVSALLVKLQDQCFDGKDIIKYISGPAIKSILLPTGGVGIYYGDLDEGKAAGNGCCLSGQVTIASGYHLYIGEWQNDLPNGSGKDMTFSPGRDGSDSFIRTVSGTFSNDKYDGEMKEEVTEKDSDYTWEYHCKEGKIILDDRWENESGVYALYPKNEKGILGRRIYRQDNVYAVYSSVYH